MKGIDVSKWQGEIDFYKVKKAGYEFVIIKAGGSDNGFYTDKNFEKNYANAKRVGLYIGAYYFVGKNFLSVKDGELDAERFRQIISGKKFEMPIVLDLESTNPKDKKKVTESTIAFCEYLESFNYYVSIYSSDIGGFKDRLDISELDLFDKWVARYGKKPEYVLTYGIWQHSETGKVDGIKGNVDLNIAYKNYPRIMKQSHKNGY